MLENSQGLFFQIAPSNPLPYNHTTELFPEIVKGVIKTWNSVHKTWFKNAYFRKKNKPKLDNKIVKKFIKLKYEKRRIS